MRCDFLPAHIFPFFLKTEEVFGEKFDHSPKSGSHFAGETGQFNLEIRNVARR